MLKEISAFKSLADLIYFCTYTDTMPSVQLLHPALGQRSLDWIAQGEAVSRDFEFRDLRDAVVDRIQSRFEGAKCSHIRNASSRSL